RIETEGAHPAQAARRAEACWMVRTEDCVRSTRSRPDHAPRFEPFYFARVHGPHAARRFRAPDVFLASRRRTCMLHTLGALLGSPVPAADGTVGSVLDAFFDERSWQIRYLLVKSSPGARCRAVVCSSDAVIHVDEDDGVHIECESSSDPKLAKRLGPFEA